MVLLIPLVLLSLTSWAADLPTAGLMVDLRPSEGVRLDASGRVVEWTNQAGPQELRSFVGQPNGRADAASGLPALVKDRKSVV